MDRIITMSESPYHLSHFTSPRLVLKKLSPTPLQDINPHQLSNKTVRRYGMDFLDPFVMLIEFTASAHAGFPDHPHRGFESFTYMLKGRLSHHDFTGHKGIIRDGDVQWVTAGKGIIHSEIPEGEGENKGLQLWINLPSRHKWMDPMHEELPREKIKKQKKESVEVRVIAGESMGVRSPTYTKTPTMILDFTLNPGAKLHQTIPKSWTSFVYVMEGQGVFGEPNSAPEAAHQVLVLGPGDGLSVWNKGLTPLRFLVAAGEPINEPVVQEGPFVMNTEDEIVKSFEDYRSFKNGFERGKNWKSSQ